MNFEIYRPKIAEIANKYGLDLVVLFGSQATGRIHAKSDIDIAVLGAKDYYRVEYGILRDLWKIFGREDLEIINLATASPTTMHAVVRDGKLLYESKQGEFFKWKFYAIRVWIETAWYRNLRDKKLLEWARTA